MTTTNPAADYLAITAKIKALEEQKETLKVQLMALDGQEVDGYSVKVTTSHSDRVESLKAIEDKSPSLFRALHDAGCIKRVESHRVIVKPIVLLALLMLLPACGGKQPVQLTAEEVAIKEGAQCRTLEALPNVHIVYSCPSGCLLYREGSYQYIKCP